MKTNILAIAGIVLCVVACNVKEEDCEVSSLGTVTFYAVNGDTPTTKTVLQSDGAVWWEPNDKIDIYVGDSAFEFTSANTSVSAETMFKGTLDGVSWENANEFWAVYPHSASNSCDGSSVTVKLSDNQTASEGTFANDLFVSIAKSNDFNLTFYNVCGGVKFSITEAGVKSVIFKSNNNETIAGIAKVGFDDAGKPTIKEVSNPKSEIILSAKEGTTLTVGEWYYIVCLPTTLEKGYTIVLNKNDGLVAERINENPVVIKRSMWGRLTEMDKSLTYSIPTVDMGLSVEWAAFNMGATAPEEYGDYYAWGETETKSDCTWSTYKWGSYYNNTLTKYNTRSSRGVVDNKTVLEEEDDVANLRLGGSWRIPSFDDWAELMNKCNSTWVTDYNGSGVNGRLVTAPNGNSIFLPANGYWEGAGLFGAGSLGYYSSSSIDMNSPQQAYGFEVIPSYIIIGRLDRCNGLSVRPVFDDRIRIESISLNKTSVSLFVGNSEQLEVTLTPADAANKNLIWLSSDTSVAKVDSNGVVSAVAAGTATIIVQTVDRGLNASCSVTVQSIVDISASVDLGLSVRWASYNLGASSPEEYGDYYAWGEIQTKDIYNASTYNWGISITSSDAKLYKYNNSEKYGTVDCITVIKPEDDAASAHWGGEWRMPTIDEFNELINNCSWEWTSNYNGTSVPGFIGTSTRDGFANESIFLPAGGWMYNEEQSDIGEYGLYWLSQNSSEYPTEGWGYSVDNGEHSYNNTGKPFLNYWSRCSGHMIRPVFGKRIAVEEITMDKSSVELGYGQKIQLNLAYSPTNAPEKGVIWTSSDMSVASVSQSGLITAIARGNCIITATSIDSQVNTSCSVSVGEPKPLELGLSVKWGGLNVGATSEEESGEYFSWGDLQSHSTYHSYPWKSNNKLTKYCMDAGSGLNGYVDNKPQLDPLDDIVHWRFGGKWRMPTAEEFNELLDETKCSWEWTKVNNKTGYLVTSKATGESIFLPRTGYYYRMSSLSSSGNGFYWSSSLNVNYSPGAYSLEFSSSSYKSVSHDRNDELAVRPVYDESIIPITGLLLNKETITLKLGESTSVYATVFPGNATYKDAVVWSSSDESVASITGEGQIVGNKVGTATITADVGGGLFAQCLVVVNYVYPELVDLGLSKLWATFNLGAKSAEELGYLFAWGEVEPKDSYDSQNYKWSNGGTFEGSYTKYCNNEKYGVNGYVDDLNELLPVDDVAFVSLGDGWSIPTYNDFRELLERCDKEWVEVNGVMGLRIISRNSNNSIFIPMTMYKNSSSAYYWSSTLYNYSYEYPSNAESLHLFFGESYSDYSTYGYLRYNGAFVRPVYSSD